MLSSTNLEKSVKFWNGILGLKIMNQNADVVELGFSNDQAKLKLRDIGNFYLYYSLQYKIRFLHCALMVCLNLMLCNYQ